MKAALLLTLYIAKVFWVVTNTEQYFLMIAIFLSAISTERHVVMMFYS